MTTTDKVNSRSYGGANQRGIVRGDDRTLWMQEDTSGLEWDKCVNQYSVFEEQVRKVLMTSAG